jgi:rfaE bifunctional protein kinase chain/domain
MSILTLRDFLDRAASVRILVAGDVMLDAWVSGSATRISPEAPVPVVKVSRRGHSAGGAANVAANILGLGSRAVLAGVAGADAPSRLLDTELHRFGIEGALVEDAGRPTTIKTRITAGGQQIVRFDDEDSSPLSAPVEEQLRLRCAAALDAVSACVISDYAKGVAGAPFCRWLIAEASRRGKPVIVDPKSRDLTRYQGATVVTPNLKETGEAAGETVANATQLSHAAELLLARIAPASLLVTRGEDGMSLFEPGRAPLHLPAEATEVADVTGAGDTVAAVLAIALGMGLPLAEAAYIANLAAGVAVRHHGTWAVGREELLDAGLRGAEK